MTALKSIAIYSTYSPTVGRVKTRIIQEEDFDKTKPWGFFMELPKIIDVEEEGFYISQKPTFLP
jgi:hypothetical protein